MNTLISINPATDEKLGEVETSTPQEIRATVEKAHNAQLSWNNLGVSGRLEELKKLYDYFVSHHDELSLIETKEMGKPISDNLDWALGQFKWNLENAEASLAPVTTFENDTEIHKIYYEPYGVVASITPWNFPLSNFIMGALQPLIAGNTVVYKISEEVPLFGKALDKAWHEAGLPTGVFNQVYGDGNVGKQLAESDINFIHFTGSSEVGKSLYKIAAEKFIPITLELGGSDAGIVFEDANIDSIIEDIFWSKFINCGQLCCGLKRLFVHSSKYDELLEKLKNYISQVKVGDTEDPETSLGCLVSKKQLNILNSQIEDAKSKGVDVIIGGEIMNRKGSYYKPTLLTNITKDMNIFYEEIFGPVLPITKFEKEDEAIKLANDTPYGLSAYIFTNDKDKALKVSKQLKAGSISHNGVDYSNPANPFGGYKGSGLGKTCGKVGLQHCCQIKTISLSK